MSEFAKTVAVALLLLAAVLVAFSGDLGVIPSGDTGTGRGFRFAPGGTDLGTSTERTTDGFFVGTVTTEDFARIRFDVPFTVSLLRQTTTHANFDDLWVSSGITRNIDKRVTFQVDEHLKGGTLRGRVVDTNRYGALVVKLNGETLLARTLKAGQPFEVNVPPEFFNNETNELRVAATSSTWRIWAPTVYITDLTFETGAEGELAKEMTFSLPTNRYPISKGRVVFKATRISGQGNLTIMLNDEQIFSGVPESGLTLKDFRGSLAKQNGNVLRLTSTGNAQYNIEQFEVLYFYNRGPATEATQIVSLNKRDMDVLPGVMEFEINRIFGDPTGLTLEIRRPDGTTTRIIPQGVLQEGNVLTITINKANVAQGENRVRFVVSGRGGYEITGFEVRP